MAKVSKAHHPLLAIRSLALFAMRAPPSCVSLMTMPPFRHADRSAEPRVHSLSHTCLIHKRAILRDEIALVALDVIAPRLLVLGIGVDGVGIADAIVVVVVPRRIDGAIVAH